MNTNDLLIKKMQQMLEKKNSYSVNMDQRSAKTQQLVRDDKVARITDLESVALTAFGADFALQELLGSRADNMRLKLRLEKMIADSGFVDLDMLTDNLGGKAEPFISETSNTVDIYFLAAGIRTDIIDILPLHFRSRIVKKKFEDKKTKK